VFVASLTSYDMCPFLGHHNAFMAVSLWVIGNVSVYMSHRNAFIAVPFMGHQNAFMTILLWVIGFVSAHRCITYDHMEYVNFEYEYEYEYGFVYDLNFDF